MEIIMKIEHSYGDTLKFISKYDLDKIPGTYIAGSVRRMKSFIGDIDLVCTDRSEIIKYLNKHNYTLLRGSLEDGMFIQVMIGDQQLDIKMTTPESLPYTMLHSTGSHYLNIAIRHMAKIKNMLLNEYGLFRLEDLNNGINKPMIVTDESEIFNALGYRNIIPSKRSVKDINEAFNLLKANKIKLKSN